MQPKTTNLLYWIFTILFAALMIFSSVESIMMTENAIGLIHHTLGYPLYFVPFTGVAKVLGSIAILIPGFVKIKEWAYAGLFFDLAAVIYSSIASSQTFDTMILFMAVWIVPGVLS